MSDSPAGGRGSDTTGKPASPQGDLVPAQVREYRHPRLNELARLGPDWDSYGAPPLTEAALTAADRLVFVPTGDGGVQVELHTAGSEVEFRLSSLGAVEYVFVSRDVEVERGD